MIDKKIIADNCQNDIVLLCCMNISRAQFIYKYFEILDAQGYKYDVIYWNRFGEDGLPTCNGNFISFEKKINSYLPLRNKIFSYIQFSIFVNRLLYKKRYKKVICLTSPMAVCVSPLLLTKYRKKYLYDFRDLTKEQFYLYRKIIQILSYNSNMFVVSSIGYLSYFNVNKLLNYCVCHNSLSKIKFKKSLELKRNDQCLRIAYWGLIRQVEYNKRVCDFFGNFTKVVFTYHGDGAYKELEDYCKRKQYSNIHFSGKYLLNDIECFASDTDILFCAYDKDFVTSPAMAVKVYDSVEYKLPILVTKDTFMHKFLKEYSCVLPIDIEHTTVSEICDWYYKIDEQSIEKDFSSLKDKINRDEDVFRDKLLNYLNRI